MLRRGAIAIVLASCASAPPSTPEARAPVVVPPLASAAPAPETKTASAPRRMPPYERLLAQLPTLSEDAIDPTFAQLRNLADPRSADGLARFLASKAPPRAKVLAAFTLAELGDERAIPTLVARLREEVPGDRDAERAIAARALADLVAMHPDHRDAIRAAAEDAVITWLDARPLPHADGMRFLALARSTRGSQKLAAWADPKEPLPKPGAPPPLPPAFSIAQAALRWLGAASPDDKGRALLTKQLARRPAQVDATSDAALRGGTAVQVIAIRALALGAADGIAEAGDARDAPALVAFVEEPKNNEQARLEACRALGLVATPAQLSGIASKLGSLDSADRKKAVTTSCWLETLVRAPSVKLSTLLVGHLAKPGDAEMRAQLGRAIGGAVDAAVAKKLEAMTIDPSLAAAAYVALVLGYGFDPAAIAERSVHDEVRRTVAAHFSTFVARDYETGRMGAAIATLARSTDQETWQAVKTAMTSIARDAGPGTWPRVVARARLLRDARGGAPRVRAEARAILQALGEDASLDSVDDE